MDFGMPFGPALCIDAAKNLECDRLRHEDLSIGHIQYSSILRWSLLLVLSGDLGLSDNYHRMDYLDLAAADTTIRALWYRIDGRSYEAEPDATVWQVDNVLGVGFAETLGSLDPEGSILNVIDAIASILARPWFDRMWSQQELVLGRSTDVMIGDHNVDWSMLVDADLFCYTNDFDYGPTMGRCVILDSRRTNRKKNALSELLTIGSLAESARNAKSSDPRDKIYGWLGLLNDEQQMFKITPNYRLSTREVYETFSFNAIRASRNLIIPALRLPGDSAELPSWVPDFNYQQGKYVENLGHLQRHYSHFSASAESTTQPHYSFSGALVLQGRVIDTVGATSVTWTSRQRPGERRQHKPWTPGLVIVTWAKFVKKFAQDPYPPTGEALADAFWRTLVQGRKMEGGVFTPADRLAALSTIIDFFKADLAPPPDIKSRDLGGDYTEDINWRGRPELLWMYLSEELETLRLFVSAAGGLGLGHYDVEAGDRIVLLAGGNMPFLVRSVDGSNKIVSVCYLHGVMHGEAWSGEDDLQDMEIC
ncbi:hypothetical protein HII31_04927 [Pseudocercospora fuligena]|uniref:Heterokaryon incompatibility domain-containing protein n=1 Tax=Pseudocercospora fuligena TaxID=685502 RepID=A0A8H6RKX6_9PEZI|nr:hypothetical protein HII31_04927 [Pseudocercospora fuligena]